MRMRQKQTEFFLFRMVKDAFGVFVYFEIKDEAFEVFREVKRLVTRQSIDN
jgi:hypothetical protein